MKRFSLSLVAIILLAVALPAQNVTSGGDTRLVAVGMGASSPSIRACETARLLEPGYQQVAPELADMKFSQSLESGTAFRVSP